MVTKAAGVIHESFVTIVSFYFFVTKLTAVQKQRRHQPTKPKPRPAISDPARP
jgi:hypothetical protein